AGDTAAAGGEPLADGAGMVAAQGRPVVAGGARAGATGARREGSRGPRREPPSLQLVAGERPGGEPAPAGRPSWSPPARSFLEPPASAAPTSEASARMVE